MNSKRTTRLRRLWLEWGKPILVVVVVLGSFRSSIADWYDVPTGSMKPTIIEGDRVLVNKLAYDLKVPFVGWRLATWGAPRRGDIVVCNSPADGVRLVKRVVAVPGDQVALRGGRLFVNGKPAVYSKLDPAFINAIEAAQQSRHAFATEAIDGREHPVMATPGVRAVRSFGPVTVPAGTVFVMGDNRDESHDSRSFGVVDASTIVGRAFRIALSLDPDHSYIPRWDRFFHELP